MSEEWYVVNVAPFAHENVIMAIQSIAEDECVEMQFFNPRYITKSKKKTNCPGEFLYSGYLYIYLDDFEFDEIKARIANTKGVIKVFEQPITQEEFDAMSETVLSMYEYSKKPDKEKIRENYAFKVGEKVKVVEGPFDGFKGTVVGAYADKVQVSVLILGRETKVLLHKKMIISSPW